MIDAPLRVRLARFGLGLIFAGLAFPDHDVVVIGTRAGKLFLTTSCVGCMSTGTDAGTWRILGGTGMFEAATGTGSVHTQATGGTGKLTDPITSFSTYTVTVTLR